MKLVGKEGWVLNPKLGMRTNPTQREVCSIIRDQKLTEDLHFESKIVCTMAAIDYVIQHEIPGDFVECGVFLGAQGLAAGTSFQENGSSRMVYLYDTYEGHGPVSEKDGAKVKQMWKEGWMKCPLERCKHNIFSNTDYPEERFLFLKGFVQDTIPQTIPDEISILRLDMDMYEPTKHVLHHLYPRLSDRGILIIDDYGKWPGARQATDEYIEEHKLCLFLQQTNHTQVTAVKLA